MCSEPAGRKRLELVQWLLTIRRQQIAPRLAGAAFGEASADDNGLLTASWRMGDAAMLRLIANLSASQISNPSTGASGTPVWGGEAGGLLPPWSVFWRIGG
jgi:maltooligosyltrehalose trehalohydrolase